MSGPQEFGKVAVLMGGWSPERAVSLDSGAAVLSALQQRGVDAHGVDVDCARLLGLANAGYARAWVALHGAGGEDGVAQAVLEVLGVAYTGSGVAASALAMDKARCKALWAGQALPTPAHRVLTENSDWDAVAAELGLPIFVKPAIGGSSLGMSKVTRAADLEAAWRAAKPIGGEVLAEAFIGGGEYTAAILGRQVLPLLKIEAAGAFYDYHAKYQADTTRYLCPCGLDRYQEDRMAALCLAAFDAVGARGWGRVDFMLDGEGNPWLLEINTVPGMTSHSLVPMAARAAGMGFEDLVLRILELSCTPEVPR